MQINPLSFNKINFGGIKQRKINFPQASDIIEISNSPSKIKSDTIRELVKNGFTAKEAEEDYSTYSKTDIHQKLINGEDGQPAHYINISENLTPAESIAYQAYGMEDYYIQYEPFDLRPEDYKEGTFSSKSREIGSCEFSPLDLAKLMNEENFDIALSGFVLKNGIAKETARNILDYYYYASGNWGNNRNVAFAEETISLLAENLDKLNTLTSDEKDEAGNLKSGLTRPLTKMEATGIIESEADTDIDNLNFLIWVKDEKGKTVKGEIEANGNLDALRKEYESGTKETEKVSKFPSKHVAEPENLEEYIDLVEFKLSRGKKQFTGNKRDYLDALKQLDSDKYLGKVRGKAISHDLMMVNTAPFPKELVAKNVEILNGISDEILDKIGNFPMMRNLLVSETLEADVAELEEELKNNPDGFNNFKTRKSILDTLQHIKIDEESEEELQRAKREVTLIKSGVAHDEVSETIAEEDSKKIAKFPKKE